MKMFGSWTELVSVLFRKNSQDITLEPNQSTTYTASRAIQLPPQDASTTLVSIDATQTLTNKTLDNSNSLTIKDGSLIIENTSDTTKHAVFSLSGLTTGTTRTYTLPDLSDTLVTVTSTNQLSGALSNKDVFASSFRIINNGATAGIAFGISALTALRTLSVRADSSDFLVTENATQTLTNKSLDVTNSLTIYASNLLVEDASNPAKQLKFDLSGATTGALIIASKNNLNRTATVPIVSADDTFVMQAFTQTLTNKTFTAPVQSSYEDFTEIATPASPSAGVLRVYSKSGDGLYIKNSSGVESQLASSSVATPTSSGTVTSYSPTIQSAVKVLSSAGYSVLTTDGYETILVSTGASTQTINLPAASSNAGRSLLIKKTDSGAGAVTIAPNGGDTVELTSLPAQYNSVWLLCDGTSNWAVKGAKFPNGQVSADTGNGYGSTNTRIRRFTNSTTVGTAITYADSATLGATFTINEAGVYAAYYGDRSGTTGVAFGVSQNGAVGTDLTALSVAQRLAVHTVAIASNPVSCATGAFRAAAGDVIRAHTDSGSQPNNSGNGQTQFTITQIVRF